MNVSTTPSQSDLFAPDRETVGVGHQEVQAGKRNDEAKPCAGQRQDEVLREELPTDPLLVGSQRRPDGQLTFPLDQPGQRQVRHVGAGEKEHHEHRAHHDQESGPSGFGKNLLPRAGTDLETELLGVKLTKLVLETSIDLSELRLCRLERGTGSESPEYVGHAMDFVRPAWPRPCNDRSSYNW